MILALIASVALAEGDELYDPAPPPDSAFVRFVNPGAKTEAAKVGTRAVGDVQATASSVYVLAKQGQRTVTLGDAAVTFDVSAGHFYTLAPADGALLVIEDTSNDNLAKALLTIYNLSDLDKVALKTADGKAAIVTDVEPGKLGNRAVNPIAVDLAVFHGDKTVGSFPKLSLKQGAAYSAFVLGSGDDIKAIWVQSVTDTTK